MTRFRHLLRSWSGLFAIALTSGCMVGCGGGEEPAADPATNEAEKPTAAAKPEAPAKSDKEQAAAPRPGGGKKGRQLSLPGGFGTPPASADTAPSGGKKGRQLSVPGFTPPAGINEASGGGGNNSSVAASPPAEPPRSEDFSVWSSEDFKNAVRERDKAILGAMAWLAENKQDDASAALVIELIAIAREPAKQPPAGIRGGGNRRQGAPRGPQGPGRQPTNPSAPQPPGGSGASLGYLDKVELFDTVAFALRGRVSSLSMVSILIQQNGPPPGYGNGQQNGPPPGYGGDGMGGPPPGYGSGQNSGGPPPGYGNGQNSGGPPPGYGSGQGMNGPPPGYGGGPPGSSGGRQQGGSNGLGAPGLGGGGRSGGRSTNASDYAHYGTLDMQAFVKEAVVSLRKIDSPKAWDGIAGLLNGTISTPMGDEETSKLVLAGLLENYGGPGHPTHMLLMELVTTDSPQSEMAMEVFTDYAGTAIDQLLGLVEPADENETVADTNNGRPAGGAKSNRQLSVPGGPPGGGLAGLGGGGPAGIGGGGNRRNPSGPGGRNPSGPGGRNLSRPGGGNNAPVRNTVSLTMASTQHPISSEHFGNVTSFLWGKDFNEAIADRLSQTGLAESGQLIALASSLPTSAARKAQFATFTANQKQRADSYTNAGLFGQIARDPGLLLSLKSMTQSKRGEGSVQTGWDEAAKLTALALRDRLRIAAETSGGLTMPNSSIKLPKGTEPDAVYHAKWPSDVQAELGTGKPAYTELLYVRTTVSGNEAQLKKLVRHYQKISKANAKINERDEARKILWYSGMKKLPTGLKRSVDVVFSQDTSRRGGNRGAAGGGGRNLSSPGGAARGPSQNAIIEVIMVEAPDPNPPTQSASLSR